MVLRPPETPFTAMLTIPGKAAARTSRLAKAESRVDPCVRIHSVTAQLGLDHPGMIERSAGARLRRASRKARC